MTPPRPSRVEGEEPGARAGVIAGLTRDIRLKALALVLAVVLWLVVEVWHPARQQPPRQGDAATGRER